MNYGKTIFSQIMDFLPMYEFHKCVERYQGNQRIRTFSCMDQFLCMAFAQLTYRESLRDIEACLRSMNSRLYHMGIRGTIARATLSKANENRDWLYADFAQILIHIARELYLNEDFGVELENTVYALDATTIDLCLTLFSWARFRKNKGAIKLHTLLDLRGSIPSFIKITDGKMADVNILDILIPEAGSFYIMDRGYLDFARLHALHQDLAFFVTRAKSNLQCRRLYSRSIDKAAGLRCDQTILLTGKKTQIWIAISIYVLVAIIKKRLKLEPSLYTILQILSITAFEKMPLYQVLTQAESEHMNQQNHNQLELFKF